MTTTNQSPSEDGSTLIDSAPPNSPAPSASKSKLRARLRAPEPESESEPVAKNPFGDPIGTSPQDADIDLGAEEAAGDPTEPEQRRAKYERLGLTKATKQLREDEDKSVVDWLSSFATGEAPIRVMIKRREPKEFVDPITGQVKNVAGHLRTYDRVIDEVEIQRNHGGGIMQLVVQKRDANGQFRYLTARTLEIGGDPRINDVPRAGTQTPQAPAVQASNPLEGPIMGKLVDSLLSRASQPPPAAPDFAGHINSAIAPLLHTQRRLEETLDRKDKELAEMRKGDPNETSFQQRLLDKFIDQDSARLQQVRIQFESELRMVKEAGVENEKRVRDQMDRDRAYMERAHEREISNLKNSYDTKVAALEQSFGSQRTVLESENRRLDRELTELRLDVKELRNKKDPSFKDQLAGIRDMKEMISDVVGDDDDKEEKSTIVKVLEGAAGSDVIAGFAQRLMAGATGAAAPPQEVYQQQLPQARPPRPRGPRLVRDRRNGQVYATDGQKAIPVHRKQPPLPPPPAPQVVVNEQGEQVVVQPPEPPPLVEAVVEVAIPYVAPENVKLATDYMTSAYGNNTDPEAFVISVKPFVPKEVLETMRQMEAEEFLRKVGGLVDGHPLLSQSGKNWIRKVRKHLFGE